MTFYKLEQQVYMIEKGEAVRFIITKRTALTDLDNGDKEIFYDLEKEGNEDVTVNQISEKDLKKIHHEAVDLVISKNFPIKR